jgi:hypothetical protein
VVVVATDALMAHAERIRDLALALRADARAAAALPWISAAGSPDPAVHRAALQAPAVSAVRAAAELADRACAALRSAVESYAAVEAEQRARAARLGETMGVAFAPLIRVLLILGLPLLTVGRVAGFPSAGDAGAVRRWLMEHPGVITNPGFVEAVRTAATSLDDTVAATLGLSPQLASGVAAVEGFTGVEAGAMVVLGAAAPLGLLRGGPVSVDRVATLPLDSGPRGTVERLARVPEGDQVRIERYDAPGVSPRYVVYVGPTETFSPVTGGEPWDLGSNVAGVAGLAADSIRATEAAMHEAGITAGDEVQFVGFSQGGLVAARLAAEGSWNATGLETYGAPTGNVSLPEGLSGMAVRNSDDFVPALAGPQLDQRLLQVERQAFAPGSPIPDELPAPAHQRSAYVATATEIDAARSDAVRSQVRAMDAFTADYLRREGAQATVMLYHAERGGGVALGGHVPAATSAGSSR